MNCGESRRWRTFCRLLNLVLLCGGATPLLAQATWLQPERFSVTPGALLVLDVLDAPEFGDTASAVSVKGLRELTGRLGDAALVVSPVTETGGRVRATVTLPKPGVALVAVDLAPVSKTLPREQVDAYLLAIHAPEPVVEAWGGLPSDAVWREVHFARVKAFVRVGEPPPGEAPWTQRTDTGLELITEQDPTAVSRGSPLPVRVFRQGRPLGGVLVTYLSSGETREHVVVTDGDGRAAAELDAVGPWLLRASIIERDNAADHDWRTETAALTFEVR